MFGNILSKAKKAVDETEQIDDRFYAEVIDELSNGYKDKALVGKAIAQSDGNEGKFDSIYMKLRASALQEGYLRERTIKKIGNKKGLEERERIEQQYKNGDFHKLFKKKIQQKGFKSHWYNEFSLIKDEIEHYTKLDFKNKQFLIVDPDGKVIESFKFKLT